MAKRIHSAVEPEKRPAIPPKRELKGEIKFPKPADIQERYYGKKELNPAEIEKRYS